MLGKLSTCYLNDASSLKHLKNRCNLWKNHRTDKNIYKLIFQSGQKRQVLPSTSSKVFFFSVK